MTNAAATKTHELRSLELYSVSRGGWDDRAVSPVRCFPSPMLAPRLTVLDRTHVLAVGDIVTDRGVSMRVAGRAPWAEKVTEAVDVPAFTLRAVR